ncbi:612_t:CDS:2 [Dentiscutata erythropus]|uniref:612_t:CDS:1 n=1 Tax=Dentiscutata erythropus TaxID=1348616 RepID=A0A9N9DIL9_9GLOM|nr:612_t:CDS:2 [Dentiscutata erythropus]
MTKSFEFRQILAASYHCKRCKEDFKCTKKISAKQRKELMDADKICNLCEKQHIRCGDNKCVNCCKKFNICNNPRKCDHCIELEVECEYTFPRTQEEFEKYSSSLKYIAHQFESLEGVVYNQAHLMFDKKMTMSSVKKLFDDDEIYFPPKERARDDSLSNREYSKKRHNRCKLHHNPYDKKTFCKCSLSDPNDCSGCKHCTKECYQHKHLARWRDTSDIVGPFEFGEWRYLKGSNENQECEEINEMKLLDMKRTERIINEDIPIKQIVENPGELLPRGWIKSLQAKEYLEKKQLEYKDKIIPEKKFYPKNFFFYGDSGPGKSSLMRYLANALSKGRPICTKARDSEYIDEYKNQVCIMKDELTHDSFNFEDLMNCCEKDKVEIKQRNKKPINIVSKFNLFTAQDSLIEIFCSKCKNKGKCDAIFRRFTKTHAYTHGYIIKLEGRYVDGCVKFTIESDDVNQPGGIICDVDYNENSFWVYNKYWTGDLPDNLIYPENSEKINKKLREKLLKTMARKPSQKNGTETSIPNKSLEKNLIATEENNFNKNVPEEGCFMEENNSNIINEEQRQIQTNQEEMNLNKKRSLEENKELEVNKESDLDRHVDKKNKK